MTIFAYVLSTAAIAVMALNLVLIISLLSRFTGGGQVKGRVQLLLALIALFLVGYVASPFLMALGLFQDIAAILAFGVFFFGALYVTVTIFVLRKIFSILNLLRQKKPPAEGS